MHYAQPLAAICTAAILLASSACSSSTGRAASSPASPHPAPPAARSAAGSEPPTVSSSAPQTTVVVSGAAGAAPADVARTCAILSANTKLLTSLASGGRAPDLRQQIAAMRSLQAAAPAQIRADITVVADFDHHILDLVIAGKRPDIGETHRLGAALAHLVAWIAAHCR